MRPNGAGAAGRHAGLSNASGFFAEISRAGGEGAGPGPCCRNPQVAAHLPGGSQLSGVDGLGVRIIEADVTATGACQL